MKKEKIILVNKKDKVVGAGESMKVHRKGKLHRAIALLIFNSKAELLLQKRAEDRYDSGGLWANTCVCHSHPGETVFQTARRQLKEEMGIETELKDSFKVSYNVAFANAIIENEFTHVLVGISDEDPVLNSDRVIDARWANLKELKNDIKSNSERYCYCFKQYFDPLKFLKALVKV